MLYLRKQMRSDVGYLFTDYGVAQQVPTVGVFNKSLQLQLGLSPHLRFGNSVRHNQVGPNTYTDGNSYCASCLNDNYALKPYFDSTLGATAGKRYTVSGGATAGAINLAQVLSTGELSHIGLTAAKQDVIDANIFAESATHFYCIKQMVPTSSRILYITKVSKDGASVAEILAYHTAGNYNVQYVGVLNGFPVFCVYGHGYTGSTSGTGASGYMYGYIIVDTAAGTAKMVSTNFADNITCVDSMASQAYTSSDGVYKVGYVLRHLASGQIPTMFKMTIKSTLTYTDTLATATTRTAMTFVGAPVDFQTYLVIINNSSSSGYQQTKTFTFVDNGVRYVAVSMHCSAQNTSHSVPYENLYGMWLFKLEDDGLTLTFKHSIKYGRSISHVLPTLDGKRFVIGQYGSGLSVVRFNSGAETLSTSDWIATAGLRSISIDQDDTVYVHAIDGDTRGICATSIFSIANSAVVRAKFEAATINWTGTPVQSNILVSAYDAFGVRVARQVNVLIDGATFTSGGGTLQQFTTSADADLVIAITINNPGQISVVPSLV